MIELQDIRYIRLGTRDLKAAEQFATQILGLSVAGRAPGMVYIKSDHRDHTLCYFDGDPATQIIGLEIKNPDLLSAAASELESAGYAVRAGVGSWWPGQCLRALQRANRCCDLSSMCISANGHNRQGRSGIDRASERPLARWCAGRGASSPADLWPSTRCAGYLPRTAASHPGFVSTWPDVPRAARIRSILLPFTSIVGQRQLPEI